MPDEPTQKYENGLKDGIYQTEIKYLAKSIEDLRTDVSSFRSEFNDNLVTVMDDGKKNTDNFVAEVKDMIKNFPCSVHSEEFTKIKTSLTVLRWVGGIFIGLVVFITPYVVHLIKLAGEVPTK